MNFLEEVANRVVEQASEQPELQGVFTSFRAHTPWVRNTRTQIVPLGTLRGVCATSGPVMITRDNMYPSAAINGAAAPGVSTGDIATLEACQFRLRPIIMTSFAFILGLVPLVLAKGAGAEMRRFSFRAFTHALAGASGWYRSTRCPLYRGTEVCPLNQPSNNCSI